MSCEKIKVMQYSNNALGCLLKKKKSRVDEFLRVETKVGMSLVGICIPREGAASDIDGVLLAQQVIFCEFEHVLSADNVRFHPCHPYVDHLPTV